MDPNTPILLHDGTVNQSAIPMRRSHAGKPPYSDTYGRIIMGVVLATYYDDDNGWSERLYGEGGVHGVFVDVRTYGESSRVLERVPVAQLGSVHDEDVRVPRPAQHDVDGGSLSSDPSPDSPPTPAHRMDGDHVLISFIEGDATKPFVLPFALPHPRSSRTISSSDGRVWRRRHNGVIIEVDKNANLNIDATGAAPDLDAAGGEVSNSGSGGVITIKTSDGSGESSVVLDSSGGVTITDAGGNEVKLTKSGDVNVSASGGVTISSAKVVVKASSIDVGVGGVPVVQHPAWSATWNAVHGVADAMSAKYSSGTPSMVVAADFKALMDAFIALSAAYNAIATKVTRVA